MYKRKDGKQFFTFDCHTHTGEGALIAQMLDNNQRFFLIDDLIKSMDQVGCDVSITFSVSNPHTDYSSENTRILEDSKKHPNRIIPFIRINPHCEETAQSDVEKFLNIGAKGIKFHPLRDGHYPANCKILVYPVLEAASKYNPVVLYHSGESINSPCLIGDVAKDFPNITFIVGHCGMLEFFREAIVVAKSLDNVLLDVTELWPPDLVRVAVNQVGMEKVIWGTDQPYIPLEAELFKVVYYSKLTDEQIEYVLGKNLASLFNVDMNQFVR